MAFLSDDLLEGREAGSRGYDLAARYVATQFQLLGLAPGAEQGTSFLQRVPLLAFRNADDGAMTVIGPGGRRPLAPNTEFLIGVTPVQPKIDLEAPLVFAGWGIVAPERGRDDYAGLDVKGKIVVVLNGAPKAYQSEERAYYRSLRTKRKEAEARGAIGVIAVHTPTSEKTFPFAEMAKDWRSWSMSFREPDGRPFIVAPAAPYLGAVSLAGAMALFEGAPRSLDAVMAAAETQAGDAPRFALPTRLHVRSRAEVRLAESANVIGLIPGADPRLKDEVVVMSAHLDHLGVLESGEGDRINNGALDNASGVATLLEAARMFKAARPPKRTLMFLMVTAEEQGLVGAEYFARNPTVPRERLAANVNLDMPILTYDFVDVVAFGAERSDLGPMVRRAAGRLGVALTPDPVPDQGLFTRSDHFRFVEQGVPAVFLVTGSGNGGEKAVNDFQTNHYHKPSDEMDLPIDFAAAAKFARLNYEIAREIADAPERPRWNAGDFFGDKFGGGEAATPAISAAGSPRH